MSKTSSENCAAVYMPSGVFTPVVPAVSSCHLGIHRPTPVYICYVFYTDGGFIVQLIFNYTNYEKIIGA